MEGVKDGRFGILKYAKFGLVCRANKCWKAGTGDLGVLPAIEARPMGK